MTVTPRRSPRHAAQFERLAAITKWVGWLAPGNHESAGKRLSDRTIPGNCNLRAALEDAA